MNAQAVRPASEASIPAQMRAWVLCDPGELKCVEKPVPVPKRAEVLVRIDAVAICATDLEIIAHGPPAMIQGGVPFNRNRTPGREYMGTILRYARDRVDDAIVVVVKARGVARREDAARRVA